MTTLEIPRRFNGPAGMANGGYACGRLASLASGTVTVRLLKPVPLDTSLEVVRDGDRLELRHGGDALAQLAPGTVRDLAVPPAPPFERAVDAARAYPGFARHPAPTCYVCGPRRVPDDGLKLFPGAIGEWNGARMVAAPFVPDASLDAGDGSAASEIVWAALDCPGYVACAQDMRPMLLGELTAEIGRRPRIGERCVVVGLGLGGSGRKHEAGTVLYGEDGAPIAKARAIWIEPRAA